MNSGESAIDLILYGRGSTQAEWPLGAVRVIPRSLSKLAQAVAGLTDESHGGWLMFWGIASRDPDPAICSALVSEGLDCFHCGPLLGVDAIPKLFRYVAPDWMFTAEPAGRSRFTSFRSTFDVLLVRKSVLARCGGINTDFHSEIGAGLNLGLRLLREGAWVFCDQRLLGDARALKTAHLHLPTADELALVARHFNGRSGLWGLFRAAMRGALDRRQAWVGIRKLLRERSAGLAKRRPTILRSRQSRCSNAAVSVAIPTLRRYEHLGRVLEGLRGQTRPADEIIIIDQTPVLCRRPEFYEHYSDLPLRVHFSDQPGLNSARNAAIGNATGEYVLLLDDDVEIPGGLIATHLALLEGSPASISCGVVCDPGCVYQPSDSEIVPISAILPGGNFCASRQVLIDAGLFDPVFDEGSGNDHEMAFVLRSLGYLSVANPWAWVVHHHASTGGQRDRGIHLWLTTESRRSLWGRKLPEWSNLLIVLRYFGAEAMNEVIWRSLFQVFVGYGSVFRRVARALIMAVLLPCSYLRLRQARARALAAAHATGRRDGASC